MHNLGEPVDVSFIGIVRAIYLNQDNKICYTVQTEDTQQIFARNLQKDQIHSLPTTQDMGRAE